jgi:hypothetical protein
MPIHSISILLIIRNSRINFAPGGRLNGYVGTVMWVML